MREKIFELLTKAGLTDGLINYDSDTGKMQLKNAELMKCFEIKGIDIVDSKIQGNIMNSGMDKDEFGFGGSRRKKNNQNSNNVQNNNQESKFTSKTDNNKARHEINSKYFLSYITIYI